MEKVTVGTKRASINCIVATIKRSQLPLPSAATFNAAIRFSSSANLERIYGIPIPKQEKGQVDAFGLLGLLVEFDLEGQQPKRYHALHRTSICSLLGFFLLFGLSFRGSRRGSSPIAIIFGENQNGP